SRPPIAIWLISIRVVEKWLPDDQLGLERARALHGLQDGHHLAGGHAHGVERRSDFLDTRVLRDDVEGAELLADLRLRLAGDDRLAGLRGDAGLRDVLAAGDGDRERAVADGDRGHAHAR